MNVGIIGCGYVGEAAARLWKKKGWHVSVTTRQVERVESLRAFADDVFVLGNTPLATFLEPLDALLISVAPDSTSDYASTYLATAKQVEEALKYTPRLREIIYTSSASVYGDQGGNWVDETTPLPPLEGNQKILHETEQLLLSCSTAERHVSIFRLGEIYGPGREIIDRLKRMNGRPHPGTGEAYTNLSHVDDIAAAADFAIEWHLDGIYNLCSDFHVSRKEFYEKLCREGGIPPVVWDPSRTSLHGGNRRLSTQKIKEMGFYPQKS